MVKRYLNCRIPCGVRQVFRIKEIITRHLNPRTPYGVRRTRERCEGDNGNLNPRTPYGVRLSKKEIRMFSNHLNPRTPYGVRPARENRIGRNTILKSTHSIRSATLVHPEPWQKHSDLNPRTPYGVRRHVVMPPLNYIYLNPRTPYGVRQQFCIKNIAFLYRLHLFFWTNCLSEKNIIVFSKGFFFLSSANLPGFSCSLPIRTT